MPNDGAMYSGLCPQVSVDNQNNPPQQCLPIRYKKLLNWGFLLDDSKTNHVDENLTRQRGNTGI